MKLAVTIIGCLTLLARDGLAVELKVDLNPPERCADSLMPHWEKAHGLNPNDSTDANKDLNGVGYANLEKDPSALAGEYSF
jgi:hypothetical protein